MKNQKLPLFIVSIWALVLIFVPIHSYHSQLLLGLSCLTFFLSTIVWKTWHPLLGITFGYFVISNLPKIVQPEYFWSNYDIPYIIAFESIVIQATFLLLIVTTFLLAIGKKVEKMLNIFIAFSFMDCTAILIKIIFGIGYTPGRPYSWNYFFLFNNASIDASFIACTIPLVLARFKQIRYVILQIVICLISYTSSGILGIGLALGSYYFVKTRFNILYASIIASLLACIGWAIQGRQLLDGSGRYGIWNETMKFWQATINHSFGAGLGTFQMHGPALQTASALAKGETHGQLWFWLHNDWLQILFETGYIGFLLMFACFILCLWRARIKPWLFSAIVTYGAIAIIQMPARHLLFGMLGAWLIVTPFGNFKES